MNEVIVIGNGIAGITAARHIRKLSDCKITVISGETDYFFSRTALMYVYMGHLKIEHTQPYENTFWTKNKIDLKKAWVKKILPDEQKIELENGEQMPYSSLILATGSRFNKFGWKGQDLKGVGGLFSYQDLQKMEEYTQNINKAVIVGGGLIGVEMAEMLLSRGISVTFLVREDRFWGNVLNPQEAKLIENHLRKHHVDLRLENELEEIIGNENGRVKAVLTKSGEIISCEWVGLTAGVSPNINLVKNTSIAHERGILVNEFLETNCKGIYAIGDCAQHIQAPNGRPPVEQVWYTGKIMGETVAKTICGNPTTYQPGNWFNSAKFFDIEYQTYGWAKPVLSPNQSSFYWQHPTKEIAIRFVFDTESKIFVGVNVFGWRLRHDLMDRYLSEKRTVEYVLANLNSVNFDPEFYKNHVKSVIESYNQQFKAQVQIHKKSWKHILGILK